GSAVVSARSPGGAGVHAAQLESGEGGARPAALHHADRARAAEQEQAMAGLLRRRARPEGGHRKAGKLEVSWCEILQDRNAPLYLTNTPQPPGDNMFVFSAPNGTNAARDHLGSRGFLALAVGER